MYKSSYLSEEDEILFSHLGRNRQHKSLLSRINRPWIITLLLVIAFLVTLDLFVNFLNETKTSPTLSLSSPQLYNKIEFSNGKLTLIGSSSISPGPPIGSLQPFIPQNESLRELILQNILVNAPLFSKSLNNQVQLRVIKLDHIWVEGDFSSTYLPSLSYFHMNLVRNFQTDFYKDQLKTYLFFETSNIQDWTVEKDLLNFNFPIQFSVGGTKIIDINRNSGAININLHNCETILNSFNNSISPIPIKELNLAWCSVSESPLSKISPDVTSVVLNNASPNQLKDYVRGLRNLEEFIAYVPNNPEELWEPTQASLSLNLNDFAPSVSTLGLSNIELLPPDGAENLNFKSSITSLTVENSLSLSLIADFAKYFKNLERVGIFNFSGLASPYSSFESIMNGNPQWLLVENFNLTIIDNKVHKMESEREKGEDAKNWLKELSGFEPATDFLLKRTLSSNLYSYSPLSQYEVNYYRYSLLGFDRVDTYDDYVIWDSGL